MNILLIGFSEKKSSIFKIFCKRNYKNCQCYSIDRQFEEHLRLVLPQLPVSARQYDAYIIDLDGVGLSECNDDNKSALKTFVGSKPVLFISHQNKLSSWEDAQLFHDAQAMYMASPYSTKVASQNLSLLEAQITSTGLYAPNEGLDKSRITPSSFDKTTAKQVSSSHTSDNSDATTRDLTPRPLNNLKTVGKLNSYLKVYFPKIYDTVLVQSILPLTLDTRPSKLIINKYVILIHPTERSALINNDFSKVVDTLSVIAKYKHDTPLTTVKIAFLSEEDYTKTASHLLADGKSVKYSLTTVLWQIAEEITAMGETIVEFPFVIQVKYIPNFATMRFIPKYVPNLIAACLKKPRSAQELYALFPELSHNQINRSILTALLANIIDVSHWPDLQDIKAQQMSEAIQTSQSQATSVLSSQDKDASNVNKDINKARHTGFFKRLLSKLTS